MSAPADRPRLGRRDLLGRGLLAGATLLGAGVAGLLLHDPHGPGRPRHAPAAAAGLPDFSAPGEGPRLAIVHGRDRAAAVGLALRALGGIERFVRPGDRVLLKVNAGFATPPEVGATTHPDLVRTLTALCLAAGAERVLVTDNPVGAAAATFQATGLEEAAARSGARLVLPRPSAFAPLTLPGGRLLRDWPVLLGPFEGVTRVVGVATVKTHAHSGATLVTKNWYGLLGGRRNVFHQDIHGIVAELAHLVRPTFVILDGVDSMVTNGPTGGSRSDLAPTDTLIVGTDPIAVDTVGAGLLGLASADLPYLAQAAAAGLGTTDVESLRPLRARLDAAGGAPPAGRAPGASTNGRAPGAQEGGRPR